MLLNDIGRDPSTTLRKINQHLESNYGFKITEDAKDHDLVLIMETIRDEITDLKIKGDDAKGSPEISKRLLVLEGLTTLREFAMLQFQSPKLETVIKGMTDFVVDTFHHRGTSMADFDEAIRDAMKVYRASKYDFPNDYIEGRVKSAAMAALGNVDAPADSLVMESDSDIEETEDDAKVDGEMSGLDEALGGLDRAQEYIPHPHSPMKRQQAERKPKQSGSQVPVVRNPHTGDWQEDPFAAKAASKKKELAMREHTNLVKNLRRLLETEVSQAEVMMAAKKFADELQEMVEKIGRLQNEDLPPVTDQMRETYGHGSASAFQTQIYGALQSVMDSLYTAKNQVDDAVGNMATTGQVSAAVDMDKDMGMDDGMDGDMGMDDADMGDAELDLDNIGDELGAEDDMGDEFGGAEGEDPLGRAMKTEAALQRKVMEMQKLVIKARKLKESRK
jgi:hypothetical protein